MWSAILDILTGQFVPYIIAAAGGAGVLLTAYLKGRSAGKKVMRDEQRKADAKAVKSRKQVDEKVNTDSDAAVRERLRRDARG